MDELSSAPTTKVEIVALSIKLVGKQQTVNTIDGGGALANDAESFFGLLSNGELGSNRWRFAQNFQQISIVTTLNPTFDGWLYECTIPDDCIMVQYLYPDIPYIVFGDKILTKSNQPFTVIYSRYVPVSKWPPAFSMYIAHALAGMLCISVTNSDRMVARIKADTAHWESRALFADAQSSRTQMLRQNPYVEIRYKDRTRGF